MGPIWRLSEHSSGSYELENIEFSWFFKFWWHFSHFFNSNVMILFEIFSTVFFWNFFTEFFSPKKMKIFYPKWITFKAELLTPTERRERLSQRNTKNKTFFRTKCLILSRRRRFSFRYKSHTASQMSCKLSHSVLVAVWGSGSVLRRRVRTLKKILGYGNV